MVGRVPVSREDGPEAPPRGCPGGDALILGSGDRAGLAIARSLGRRGIAVHLGSAGPSLAEHCRYVRTRFRYAQQITDTLAFAEQVAREARRLGVAFVFPAAESVMIALDRHRELLPDGVRVALPERPALHRVLDKVASNRLALDLGIPVPDAAPPGPAALVREWCASHPGPWVVKPRGMDLFTGSRWPAGPKVHYLRRPSEVEGLVAGLLAGGGDPVVQAHVPGLNISHGLLSERGAILGLYQYHAVRTFPAAGGVSCFHRTMAVDPRLLAHTERLVGALEWSGLAGIDYRVDPATGQAWFLEINGRAWAPIGAAMRAGLDFPWAALQLLAGRQAEAARTLQVQCPADRTTRYLRGEVLSLLSSGGPEGPDMPTRTATLRAQLRDSTWRSQGEIWDPADPVPALVEGGMLLARMVPRPRRRGPAR